MTEFSPDLVKSQLHAKAREAAMAAALVIETYAKEHAPKQTGALAGSIHTKPVGDGTTVEIASEGVIYAARQHEGVGFKFNLAMNPNAKAKFVEDAPQASREEILQAIAESISGSW